MYAVLIRVYVSARVNETTVIIKTELGSLDDEVAEFLNTAQVSLLQFDREYPRFLECSATFPVSNHDEPPDYTEGTDTTSWQG